MIFLAFPPLRLVVCDRRRFTDYPKVTGAAMATVDLVKGGRSLAKKRTGAIRS